VGNYINHEEHEGHEDLLMFYKAEIKFADLSNKVIWLAKEI